MSKQDFRNHIRYYAPHHLVFYPVVLTLIIVSAICIFKYPDHSKEWMAITALFILVGWVAYMMRQHYALTNQNRIVRLEMRLRYFQLTGKRFEEIENHLAFGQVAALRFASDSELLSLIKKTIDENLSPSAIKKLITQWIPDHMRV